MINGGEIPRHLLPALHLEIEDLCPAPVTKWVLHHKIITAILEAFMTHTGNIPFGFVLGAGLTLHL